MNNMKKINILLLGLALVGGLVMPTTTRAQITSPWEETAYLPPWSPVQTEVRFKIGESGPEVRAIQEKLRASGDFTYPEITGYYGQLTDAAVKKYELRTGQKIIKPMPRPLPMPPVSSDDITVLSPNGGEKLNIGDKFNISWSIKDGKIDFPSISIHLREHLTCTPENHPNDPFFCSLWDPAPPKSYAVIVGAPNSLKNGGSYAWLVGRAQRIDDDIVSYLNIPSGKYFLEICYSQIIPIAGGLTNNTSRAQVCDKSDSYFTISSNDIIPYPRPFGNQPPVIHGVSGPTVLRVGEAGEWSVKASDPENGSLKYAIDWGDRRASAGAEGLPSVFGLTFDTTQKSTFTHSYGSAGTYTITFAVSDDWGNSAKSSMTVRVGNSVVGNNKVQVISPNGGESLLAYSNATITWQSPSAKVDLYLQPDWSCPAGYACPAVMPQPYLLDKNISGNVYYWIVATDVNNKRIPSGSYKIEICPAGSDSGCDSSDNSFRIYSNSNLPAEAEGELSVDVVTSKSEKTLTSARLSVHTSSGRFVATGNTSDGPEIFSDLAYGSYVVYAQASGYAPARKAFTLSAKKPSATVVIKLKTAKTVDMPKVVTSGIVSSNPPNGAIDARMPSNVNGSGFWQGWNQFVLKIAGVNTASLTPTDFAMKTTGGVSTKINDVSVATGDSTLGVILTTQYGVPIPEGERTVIRHEASGTEICLGYLPGDVDGSAKVDGADLLALIDAINGVKTLPDYSTDLNRDGVTNNEDQLTWIDLTNGADAYSAWFGETLPKCPKI